MDLSGRIGASSSARGTTAPIATLAGRASATSSARVITPAPWFALAGRTLGLASASASGTFPLLINLAGRTMGRASGGFAGSYPLRLGGYIRAGASGGLGGGVYTANFAGRISGTSWAYGHAPQPLWALIGGRASGALRGWFGISELVQPLPPYPTPFPVRDLQWYLDRITSEHNQRPKYMATVQLSADPLVADQKLAAGLPGLFDVDYAVGEQEDFTGQWIGKSRWIELPNVFFSWDTPGLGWNESNWKGPFDAENILQRLDDYHYRMLLYAAIVANHWNGSIPRAYEAWDTLFKYTGLKVVIQDFGNMTMMYGLLWDKQPDTVLLSLFVTGQMDLKPEGIDLIEYIFQVEPGKPLFAWDAESDSAAGWDEGYWGTLVRPGEGYVPLAREGDTE